MKTNTIKLKTNAKGVLITCKNAPLAEIKKAFDHFILSPKKSKKYYVK